MAAEPRSFDAAMSNIAKRLREMGSFCPNPPRPSRIMSVSCARARYSSSPASCRLEPTEKLAERHQGKLSPDSEVDAAREAARLCAINVLAQAHAALGDLDKVIQVVRLGGFFNVESTFDPLPQAMNGASNLIAEVFGDKGRHARTTVGVAHLPLNALAEVEAVFEIEV